MHVRPSFALLLVCAGCARTPAPENPVPENPPTVAEAETVPIPAPLPVRAPLLDTRPPDLGSLTLREKVAQLVLARLGGEYWADDRQELAQALDLVTREHIGGFVIFASASPYDVAAKLNTLQRAARLPLLIGSDLEWGSAMRVRGGTAFPGNMALGATDSEDDARAVGRVIALEARTMGIQLVLAPVADVNNNPANPIINTRSFGENPAAVGRLSAAVIRGLRDHGALATAKHFPGHGDTDVNSHLGLPVVTASRARLDTVELVPFRAAIAAGVDAVMSAHIALPAITGDTSLPGTLSGLVLDSLLRRAMGFRGLVLSEALDMRAVTDRYGPGGSAVAALRAGADVILLPTDVGRAIDAVVRAVETGELTEARLDSSVARVLAVKEGVGLFRRRLVDLNAIARTVGRDEYAQLAGGIAQRSIVLLRDDRTSIPLAPALQRVLVVAYGDGANTGIGAGLAGALRAAGRSVTLRRLWPASGPASYASVRALARGSNAVLLVAAPRPQDYELGIVVADSLAALAGELARGTVPLIVASLGSPYLIQQMPTVPAYLVAWADNDITERAVANALLGRADIGGRMPVSLPPSFGVGTGLARAARPGAASP